MAAEPVGAGGADRAVRAGSGADPGGAGPGSPRRRGSGARARGSGARTRWSSTAPTPRPTRPCASATCWPRRSPLIVGYDQDEWARAFDYHAEPLEPRPGRGRGRARPHGAAAAPDERGRLGEGGAPHRVGPLHRRGLAAHLRRAPRGPRRPDRAEPGGVDRPKLA